MGGQPVKKILVSARGLSTQEVEVKSLHIRTNISINREGVTAFAAVRCIRINTHGQIKTAHIRKSTIMYAEEISKSGGVIVTIRHLYCEDKEVLITINKAIDASPELRRKKKLVETFIAGINDVDDVMNKWHSYVVEQRDHDLDMIIVEEKLKPEDTRNSWRMYSETEK